MSAPWTIKENTSAIVQVGLTSDSDHIWKIVVNLSAENGMQADVKYPAPERWSKEPSETDLLDGCILPTEKQVDMLLANRRSSRRGRRKRAAMYTHIQKWNVLSIPWKFDGKHTGREKQRIRSAFKRWSDQTCIRFREMGTNVKYAGHHILVTKKKG
ncbi:hypothetical protein NP493_122g07004 [Ridgeia piscesae]|uniref:Peptidase M12A domain-containing protein n=1 Tax=Ridgeia piscesae TaxID=27915 RepID=A0AAD9P657_RIDPI|nr:hypothetical protein NP493_122g07004 [Ridgeia piscesae]